jgi:hypothetical protein
MSILKTDRQLNKIKKKMYEQTEKFNKETGTLAGVGGKKTGTRS